MKVVWSWLADLVDLEGLDLDFAAQRLTTTGIKVERIERVAQGLGEIVVARTHQVEPHPNADRLRLVEVELVDRRLTVVCGAPNVESGQLVAYAPAGATLPGGLKLEERKIRGIVSQGMICSARELNLSEDGSGILVLDEGLEVGTPLTRIFPADAVLHLEVTSNRPDCLGHLGVARELAAATGRSLRPAAAWAEIELPGTPYGVEVRDFDLCPRYMALAFTGVEVRPSPEWLRRRLTLAGVRPISNAVDVTNYVMLETGQPLHVYDRTRLRGDALVVRSAEAGETVAGLDGVTRSALPGDLVIADRDVPVGLAGVMGGSDSGVTETTGEIVLEAASFFGPGVRGTARRFGIRTESSSRFEKGLSAALPAMAAARAAALLAELTGARLTAGSDVRGPQPSAPGAVEMAVDAFARLLGTDLEPGEPADHLRALGFEVQVDDGRLRATPPLDRLDVRIPEDLVEEVGRLHGLDRIPATLPGRRTRDIRPAPPADPRRTFAGLLAGSGFTEAVSNSLVDSALLRAMGITGALALRNPMSSEQDAVRPALLPGLLTVTARNVGRGNRRLRLFELGDVFPSAAPARDQLPVAQSRLAMVALDAESESATAAQLVGWALRRAAAAVGASLEFVAADGPGLRPGRSWSVNIGGTACGHLGELAPAVGRAAGLDLPVVCLEIRLDPLRDGLTEPARFTSLPRQPAVLQDLALEVDLDLPAARLVELARSAGGDLLVSVDPFDDYRGAQVAEGRKSIALRLVFRAAERTLTEGEVRPLRQAVIRELESKAGAQLR